MLPSLILPLRIRAIWEIAYTHHWNYNNTLPSIIYAKLLVTSQNTPFILNRFIFLLLCSTPMLFFLTQTRWLSPFKFTTWTITNGSKRKTIANHNKTVVRLKTSEESHYVSPARDAPASSNVGEIPVCKCLLHQRAHVFCRHVQFIKPLKSKHLYQIFYFFRFWI